LQQRLESPEYVRVSLGAAMTLGLTEGRFFRDAALYCLNLLLTYSSGCIGRCAYCGLAKSRRSEKPWTDHSFIRVDWPTVSLNEVLRRIDSCTHVERVCVSMLTYGRARRDCLTVVRRLREKTDEISALITPTIVDHEWLYELKKAGCDKVGIAVDTATPELFGKLRGSGVGGPHRWQKYWQTVKETVEVFHRFDVGVHLVVGLGENEEEMVRTIQMAYDLGALTHLFSFFPEEGSLMEGCSQPPIGHYRRVQLARYLVNKGLTTADNMGFDAEGKITGFGVDERTLDEVVDSGLPFITSGCASKNRENACNRPFSDCTPYQALIGEMRNYPFTPTKDDGALIRRQLGDYSTAPVKIWVEELTVA